MGGSASYQWTDESDIDISIFADNWPENIDEEKVKEYHQFFRKIEIPFKKHVIHK